MIGEGAPPLWAYTAVGVCSGLLSNFIHSSVKDTILLSCYLTLTFKIVWDTVK